MPGPPAQLVGAKNRRLPHRRDAEARRTIPHPFPQHRGEKGRTDSSGLKPLGMTRVGRSFFSAAVKRCFPLFRFAHPGLKPRAVTPGGFHPLFSLRHPGLRPRVVTPAGASTHKALFLEWRSKEGQSACARMRKKLSRNRESGPEIVEGSGPRAGGLAITRFRPAPLAR